MKRKEPEQVFNEMDENSNSNPEKMSRTDKNKEEKYDRQLRLWGHNGQSCLGKADVCLLNVTAAGTETLKCLILPGVGKYTIVDNTLVTPEDLGSNFFLDSESVGKSKAKATCRLLQDLNPDSVGHNHNVDPVELLENDPQFFKKFTVVICSKLCEHSLIKLGNLLWQMNIPLVVCENYGYFGLLRLVVKEHVIVESHPDNALEDLRLDCPFPELLDYIGKVNMDAMNTLQHSHTPYLIVLYKFLEKWRQKNNAQWPQNYQEKCQIKELIQEGLLKNDEGMPMQEENFEEALRNVNNTFTKTKIPSDVLEVLNDKLANHPLEDEQNASFWILVRALKEFVNQNGVLPLRGTLPDMFSDSRRYIELQNLYKKKANQDVQCVEEFVREALADLQMPASLISTDDIKLFCKNAYFFKVQCGLSIHDEFRQNVTEHTIKETIQSAVDSASDIYMIFRAIFQFADNGRFPAVNLSDKVNDLSTMKRIIEDIIKEIGIEKKVPNAYLEELFRCNVSELHTTAAVIGGTCAQEVIKLVTKQFVPVDNTFIYDGISHQSASLKL